MALRALLLATSFTIVAAQAPSGCIPLTGSTQCPGFASQSINAAALSEGYPFLANVNDVTSFDQALAAYVAGPYRALKYNTQLGCTNTSSTFTLQYATTVLCSVFTQQSFAAGCVDSSIVNRMTCQSTCLQYATAENFLVADPSACGTTNTAGPARQGNLTYDFTTCTDWTTLISNNTATCVLGQNNEPNCGFQNNQAQLCDYCDPSLRNGFRVDSCCGADNVNLAGCGYTLAAAQIAPSPTLSSLSQVPTATGIQTTSDGGLGAGGEGVGDVAGGGLSGGAIAGIVIGSILGALLLLALLFFLLRRRKRDSARTGSGQRALLGKKGSPNMSELDNEKGYPQSTSSAGGSKGNMIGAAPFGFASKPGKLTDSPPSPGSSDTPNFASSDAFLGSGKSSSHSSYNYAQPIAGIGAAAAVGGLAKRESDKPRPLSQDTMATASSNERNLVPSVRDQYSNAEIVPGSEVVAIYAYSPNLPDELKLEPDAIVTVRKIYDDGWAVGTMYKPDGTTQEGAFPLVVCTVVGADSGDNASSNSSANSSSAAAYTAREAARSSGSHLPRSSTSGRTSSIGGTSFESAQSATTGSRAGRRGFLAGLRRR